MHLKRVICSLSFLHLQVELYQKLLDSRHGPYHRLTRTYICITC